MHTEPRVSTWRRFPDPACGSWVPSRRPPQLSGELRLVTEGTEWHAPSAIPQPGAGQRPPEDEKEVIRRAIQKELKIKEGVVNLRRVATDRRHLGHVQQLLRSSNRRLEQLHGELQELHTRILLPGPAAGECATPGDGRHQASPAPCPTTRRASSGSPVQDGRIELDCGRGVHGPHLSHPQNPWPRDPSLWQSSRGPGTWRPYRGSCRWS